MDTQIDRIIRQSGTSVSDFGKVADQVLARQASSLPTPGASQDATSQLLPSDYTLDDAAHRAYDALVGNVPIVFLTGRRTQPGSTDDLSTRRLDRSSGIF